MTRDEPLTLTEYLDIAHCPESEDRWGGEPPPEGGLVGSLNHWRERIQAVTPPPELRSLHENMLEGLRLQSEAYAAAPIVDGRIDVGVWGEGFEDFSRGSELTSYRNADLDADVEKAVGVHCEPRFREYEQRAQEIADAQQGG